VWTLKNPPSVFPLKLLQLPNTVLETRGFFTSNLAHHHIGVGDFNAFDLPPQWIPMEHLPGWYLLGSLVNRKIYEICATLLPHKTEAQVYTTKCVFVQPLAINFPPKKTSTISNLT